jgi:hypothetical protein
VPGDFLRVVAQEIRGVERAPEGVDGFVADGVKMQRRARLVLARALAALGRGRSAGDQALS